MSYILDALRRADAERERGAVPSLHTQSTLAGSGGLSADLQAGRPPWLWLGAGALGAIVIGGVAWAWLGTTTRHEEPVVATAAPATIGSANPPAAMSTPPPPVPNPPPTGEAMVGFPRALPRETMPVPAPVAAPPSPDDEPGMTRPSRRPNLPSPAPVIATRPIAAAKRVDAAPATATGSDATLPTSAAGPVVADRIYAVSELPDDMQRELPKLAVGGSMYSPTPASRVLIINGQVLHEGDTLPPGLVLRQIRLKSAVFSYRDRRFEIRY